MSFKVGDIVQQGYNTENRYEIIRVVSVGQPPRTIYEVIRVPVYWPPVWLHEDQLKPYGTRP
jgi:hypothetical protein